MHYLDLSIIIVSYNTKNLLLQCLNSIYKHTKLKFEVFVVDNNSSDNSIQAVRELFPKVKLLSNNSNLGFSKANNEAFKKCQGKYVALLNSDTILISDVFKELIQFMNSNDSIGAVGPQLLNKDMSLQLSAWSFPNLFIDFYQRVFIYRIFYRIQKNNHNLLENNNFIKEVDWITGACFLVRHEVLNQVGYLDENFFMYFEDIDFCKRIKKLGYSIYYFPHEKVIHLDAQSRKKISEKIYFEAQKSRLYFYKKHLGNFQYTSLRIFMLLYHIYALVIITRFTKQKLKYKKAYTEVLRYTVNSFRGV